MLNNFDTLHLKPPVSHNGVCASPHTCPYCGRACACRDRPMAVTPVPLIHIRWHDTAVVILLGCPLDLVVLHVYGVSINLSPHFQAPFLGQDRSPAPFGSRQPVGQGGVTLNLLIASLFLKIGRSTNRYNRQVGLMLFCLLGLP